jgi:hypothetical protein
MRLVSSLNGTLSANCSVSYLMRSPVLQQEVEDGMEKE